MADRRPAASPGLGRGLVTQLTRQIVDGQLSAGQRLPTEQRLMASFGVSRTVVREAVAALKSEGLVVSRQGSGAFVAADARRRPFRIDPDTLGTNDAIVHVMELRLGVEIEAAALAASTAGAAELAQVAQAHRAMALEVEAGRPALDEDFSFHCAVADATGNPLIARFLRFLGPFIIPRPLIRFRPHAPAPRRAYLLGLLAEHARILSALEAGDPAAARGAMREHLERGLALNRVAPQRQEGPG
jgi:DNA-binding FadR family transcriptional regulator